MSSLNLLSPEGPQPLSSEPGYFHRLPLRLLCESMKRQIVSRAFYGCEYWVRWGCEGWEIGEVPLSYVFSPGAPTGLAYCRHLSTVRTHLSALVRHNIIPPARPPGASGGLTKDVWSKYQKDEKVYTLECQGQRVDQRTRGEQQRVQSSLPWEQLS